MDVVFLFGENMEQIDLEMVRGDDDGWTFECTDEHDAPLDFTGCRFDLHIKPDKKGEIVKLSSVTGEISVRGNSVDVVIGHDKTENANWTAAKWDLQCTYGAGDVKTLCGGNFELIHDVTRGVE